MCGRYTLIKLAEFTDVFPWVRPFPGAVQPPRYNIAPSQPVAVVANDGRNTLDFFKWGLVPSWAKDISIGNRMINARAETLAEKPAFNKALIRRRCLIPADGFYEWKRGPDPKVKTPMYIRMKNGKPFAFAGLWEIWQSVDGSELFTCTIITAKPNELVKTFHDRMAVILPPEKAKRWLSPDEEDADAMTQLLTPYPADEMEAYAVGRMVNSPKLDSERCIEPAGEEVFMAATPKRKKKRDDQPGLFG